MSHPRLPLWIEEKLMRISLHRLVTFVVSAGPLLCGVLLFGGCNKDKAAAVSTANRAAPAAIVADGGVACVVGDAPQRTLSDAITPDAIMQAMTLTADRQLANPAKWATNLWHYAAFWIGMTKLAPLAESPKYYDAIKKNGDANEWKPALRPGHADDQAIASSYFYVYSIERDPKVIEPSLARFDEMTKRTFNEPLTWDEVRETPGKNASGAPAIHTREWAWCDALFMAPPAMAEATTNTGDMKYLNLANKLWWKTTDFLYEKDEHLYYRDSRFFEKREPNGKKVFWSRGNGWVLAGTARMLQNMPEQVSDRGRYLTMFRAMASRIASLQGKDGFWRASLLDPDSVPRPESSGTAFFTYALAWGINQGILDRATFEPVVHKGWSAITGAVLSSGKLGWVQEVGFAPGETCWDRTEVYGVGAFLLAGSELYRTALLGDSPRITRSFKNPQANARFDEVINVPLQAEEMNAVASGSKLIAIDGRSGEFLPTQLGDRANGPLLVRVGSLGPSEERRVHIYRMAAATKLPPLRAVPFSTQPHREKQGTVVIEIVGG
jgi:unsaturated rhamnogalacturonyl hydrolase